MSYLDQYKRRMQANAGIPNEQISNDRPITLREAQINRATDSQRATFYDSPTLTKVIYNGEPVDVIKSDKYKDIELQTFLFPPETPVQIGSLLNDGEYYYLAVMKNGDRIYPELLTQLCNDTFEVPMGVVKIPFVDRFGNTKYREEVQTDVVPAVLSDKDYSISNNSILPLPSGRINIEMQFNEKYLEHFHINYRFEHSGGDYKVTDIRKVSKTPTEHYIKISATRVVTDDVT